MSARRPIAPVIRNHITKALDLLEDEGTPLCQLLAKALRDDPLKGLNAIVKWVEIEGTNMRRYPPSMREPALPLADGSPGYQALDELIRKLDEAKGDMGTGDAEAAPNSELSPGAAQH